MEDGLPTTGNVRNVLNLKQEHCFKALKRNARSGRTVQTAAAKVTPTEPFWHEASNILAPFREGGR